MRIDGGCHCGAVQFTAVIDPGRVVICHCTDCQTMSGAPYRVNVPVLTENFELEGELTSYSKTGSSGSKITTTFCPRCGSPVYSFKGDAPSIVHLRLGGVRQRTDLPPRMQGFCDSAMPWAWDIKLITRAPVRPRRSDPDWSA
jgi:hypothetical protein